MFRILKYVMAFAISATAASCGKTAGDTSPQPPETPELTNAADSLGWFLAEAYANYAIELIDSLPDSHLTAFDASKYAAGFSDLLECDLQHAGEQYGLIHGSVANDRLFSIHSCGINIPAKEFVEGFREGMKSDTISNSTTEALDRLMATVNSQLIAAKRNKHK